MTYDLYNKIFHVPHSSDIIPSEFLDEYLITPQDLTNEINIMKDDYTYELVKDFSDVIKFPFSRIFCDVERFDDDTEIMNKVGMGVIYTHSHDMNLIRVPKKIEQIKKIYNEHHKVLNNLVEEKLKKDESVLILDIHSYSDSPLPYEIFKDLKRPDICLGVNYFHLDEEVLEKILYIIKDSGFSHSINEPFKGCIIPSEYYMKNKNVKGIMLEFNKKTLSENFEKIKNIVKWIERKI